MVRLDFSLPSQPPNARIVRPISLACSFRASHCSKRLTRRSRASFSPSFFVTARFLKRCARLHWLSDQGIFFVTEKCATTKAGTVERRKILFVEWNFTLLKDHLADRNSQKTESLTLLLAAAKHKTTVTVSLKAGKSEFKDTKTNAI